MASEVSHNTSIEDNLDESQDICYNSHDPAINGIIVDMIKENMVKVELRDKELRYTLKEQIIFLRKELDHKNHVINTLIINQNHHKIYNNNNDDHTINKINKINKCHNSLDEYNVTHNNNNGTIKLDEKFRRKKKITIKVKIMLVSINLCQTKKTLKRLQ